MKAPKRRKATANLTPVSGGDARPSESQGRPIRNIHEILGLVVGCLGALLGMSIILPESIGAFGRAVSAALTDLLGKGGLSLPLFLLLLSLFVASPRRRRVPLALTVIILGILLLDFLVIMGFAGQGGKLNWLGNRIREMLGPLGAPMVLATIGAGCALLLTQASFSGLLALLRLWYRKIALWVSTLRSGRTPSPSASVVSAPTPITRDFPLPSEAVPEVSWAGEPEISAPSPAFESIIEPVGVSFPPESIIEEAGEPGASSPEEPPAPQRIRRTRSRKRESPPEPSPAATDGEAPQEGNIPPNPYQLPALDLLKRPDKEARRSLQDPGEQAKKLEETLRSFEVEAKVVHVERGPAVTRYELQPARGVKVSKIVGLSNDIALNLAARAIRIEAPIPGKSAVGIEIPNDVADTVSLRDILESQAWQGSVSKLTLALGKDISGSSIVTDLSKMPHLLIAGATGSGKTVCVNTLVASILYKATPLDVQFLMIDPKRVELTMYNAIPHLIREVLTEPKQAAVALMELTKEMERRYDQFAQHRVRNIHEYNAQNPNGSMPYIVVLIDELADLMMMASALVESSICRLAQLARAAGIHLIVATQRPSVNVITGLIKANIPSRIAFAVSSQIDSRTILDSPGAEKLLGLGDMLFLPIEENSPVRIKGAFVTLSEIEALVSFWKEQAAPTNKVEVAIPDHVEGSEEGEEDDSDELLDEAIKTIMDTRQASTSLLQRRLKIGYARAGRLMDIMERRGIVGPADGSKPRQILCDPDLSMSLGSGVLQEPGR